MPTTTNTAEEYIESPVNIELFRNLLDLVEEKQKQIIVSKNLTLDLTKIMDHYDGANNLHVDFLQYIVSHCSVYSNYPGVYIT